MSAEAFDLEEHRSERAQRLERENEHLRAERIRLERLLADALTVAVAGTGVSPTALLDLFGALRETDLARPAFIEHRERMRVRAVTLRALKETA
jgi:hypothetical protein